MTFDATSFLDSSVTETNDTVVVPVPVGDYAGVITKVAARTWQSGDGSKSGVTLDVFWSIEDEQVKAELGRAEVICKQGVMLDTTPTGGIDTSKGKNVQLGRLREACGLNVPGKPFSFNMLPGQSAKVSVSHRAGQDGETYSEVKKVAPM
jgi:hypothetical protein